MTESKREAESRFRLGSIWAATTGIGTGSSPHRGKTHVDVVVIGGGIAGLTAALSLSRAGQKVALLEARRISLGTTGRSTGGLQAELLQEAPLPFKTQAALRLSGQAQFHPLLYAQGLASRLALSCSIFENSPATEIDHTQGRVTTPGGEVRAKYIIVATHTPKGISALHLAFSPIREFGIAAQLKDASMVPGIY